MPLSDYQQGFVSAAMMQGWDLVLSKMAVAEEPAKALELAQQIIAEAERYPLAVPHLPAVLHSLAPLASRENADSVLLWSLAIRAEAVFKVGRRGYRVFRFAMFLAMIPFAAAVLEEHAFEAWWNQQVVGFWADSPVKGKRDQLRVALGAYGSRFEASVRTRLVDNLPSDERS